MVESNSAAQDFAFSIGMLRLFSRQNAEVKPLLVPPRRNQTQIGIGVAQRITNNNSALPILQTPRADGRGQRILTKAKSQTLPRLLANMPLHHLALNMTETRDKDHSGRVPSYNSHANLQNCFLQAISTGDLTYINIEINDVSINLR
jgi:hypothetical protein